MISTIAPADKERLSTHHRLMLFFAIAYLSQGISCAQFGVIAQPIQYFMMQGLNLSAAEISSYLAIMMIPWVLKPLYGLISDFVPLFGYRRKSYLILANSLAAIAFIVMLLTDSMPVILSALFLTAAAMAIATALMVGLAVEQGRAEGKARDYFCIQEVCYYSANMAAALAGGLLCHFLTPRLAFHSAAAIATLPLIVVSLLTALLLNETKTRLDTGKLRETWDSLLQALCSPSLWLAGIFSFCWNFIPSMGVPLYFYQSKTLCFSQASIGQLAAWNAVGMLAAALLYPKLTRNMSVKTQLQLAALLILTSSLSYLGLSGYNSAVVLELFRGTANMVAILSLYILAATACPNRTEVSVMAILVTLRNVGTNAATFAGGQLFTHTFHGQFYPLVFIAALAPAISLLLLPLLPAQHQAIKRHS
jgi:predicted MFS family arabinose efflux permease